MITLTRELLHSAGTSGCGHNNAQLRLLGVSSAKKGWLSRLVGTQVSEDNWAKVVALRGVKPSRRSAALANVDSPALSPSAPRPDRWTITMVGPGNHRMTVEAPCRHAALELFRDATKSL